METPIQDHGAGFRTTGYRQIIGVHTLLPRSKVVGEALDLPAVLEEHLPADLSMTTEINTLESLEGHAEVYHQLQYTVKPD